jgi:8-oxo-dGTP pyrophosphatase MutT (NUDIX family)
MAESAGAREAVAPVPAAALLLVRDGARGLEVFLLKRHHEVDFVPGAMVFPGGKLDPGDSDPALRGCCGGAEGLADAELALRVAAIREAFEECGVLLARPRKERRLVSAERLRELASRHRADLQAERTTLARVARAEELELACDLPVPFAHWITPEGMHRRYDTHFFLVAAPPDQVAAHDGRESVDSLWIAPRDAVAEEEAGRLAIIFPTLMQLRKLGREDSVAAAIAAARRQRPVTVLPVLERGPGGPRLRIPAEAGYDVVEAPLSRLLRRPPR